MAADVEEWEIALASQVGAGIAKNWQRVSTEDVIGDLHLWLCENARYLVRWREEGTHGRNKLRLSLKRRANKFCRGEFETIKPFTVDWEYTEEACAALLEAIFAYTDWSEITTDGDSDVWASLADVSRAFDTLSQVDRGLLELRYGNGLRFQEIADEVGLASADAARMRVNRALKRVAERASRGTVRWVAGMDLSPKGHYWMNGKRGAVE